MKEVTRYVADDGMEYKTQKEAELRDEYLLLAKKIQNEWYYGIDQSVVLKVIWNDFLGREEKEKLYLYESISSNELELIIQPLEKHYDGIGKFVMKPDVIKIISEVLEKVLKNINK